ncbi:hypothetical protein EB796_019089 [Bugula neritina]|uniref:Uncharacterized protein n=1 Tax=Bugula neritina TaxID=10212 RepID=A0A7J7JA89_BUGNE|nr:hypothetical protein EB796_019089 [Bugula neritina]
MPLDSEISNALRELVSIIRSLHYNSDKVYGISCSRFVTSTHCLLKDSSTLGFMNYYYQKLRKYYFWSVSTML